MRKADNETAFDLGGRHPGLVPGSTGACIRRLEKGVGRIGLALSKASFVQEAWWMPEHVRHDGGGR